jgi:Asp-tRNA(Asn)/Glu-tRNA(Gln) amidotransferase A subunit family amidase
MTRTDTNDLCYLTATEAIGQFRARRLSPVELLEAQLARIERLDPGLNAIRAVRADAAREAARAAEVLYKNTPELAGPLAGVPVLLKNEHSLIGEETDVGSLLLAGQIDTENAPITQRLLDAGAVIHARTQVPEFCVATFTRSLAHGVTRNPWSRNITCGGSSGGSGVALATGMGVLSSASDIGGSIRIPSAYCGVVGFKPSYGRVPESSFEFAVNTHNHNGLMCRSVADAVLMFNAINGPHRCDPSSLRPKLTLPPPDADVRGLRVALSVDLGYFTVAPDIKRNTRALADMLRERGAIVDEIALRWDRRLGEAFTDALVFVLGRGLAALVDSAPHDQVSDYVLRMVEMGREITPERHLAATAIIGELHEALQDVFDNHDLLLCPTVARNDMPAIGVDEVHEDLLRNGMTYPFNVYSRHPVLAVPSGFGDNGVPTGVQLVGDRYAEETVIRAGAALEEAVGWLKWRPAI